MTDPKKPTGTDGDARLAKIASDPRFRRPKKKQTQLKVDQRFKSMFTDSKFTTPYSVDKYGRKVGEGKEKQGKKELERFYRLEQEEDEKAAASSEEESDSSAVESESGSEADDYSSASDVSSSEEEAVLEEAFSQHPLVNTSVPLGDATRRLAIVNLDWDQIRAIDLFTLLNGFKPPTGIIQSVKIYPSEFGKERMAKEAIEGPPKEIFGKDEESSEEEAGTEFSSEEEDFDEPIDILEDLKKNLEEEGNDFNSTQLRKYQLERLRYYYAVVECDSASTAAALYHHCDGREFETSTNTLDLRYIPDDVSFDDDEAKDVATEMPKRYVPKPAMVTDALQRSSVKLTWDQDDPERKRVTRVNFAKTDYKEADLKAYLASSSEDEDEEERIEAKKLSKEEKIAKYRALLLGGKSDNVFGRKSHEDNDDLAITFTSGIMDKVIDSEEDEEDSESFEEPEFESEVEEEEEGEGKVAVFDADGNLVKKVDNKTEDKSSKKKFGKKEEPVKFTVTKEWSKDKKSSTTRKQHKKHSDLLETPEGDFSVNVTDPRFQAVFDSADYAIDPSNPLYKNTDGMKKIVEERQKRRREEGDRNDAIRSKKGNLN